jgi:hypothetical protein
LEIVHFLKAQTIISGSSSFQASTIHVQIVDNSGFSEDDKEIYYNDGDEDHNIPLSALRDIYRIF